MKCYFLSKDCLNVLYRKQSNIWCCSQENFWKRNSLCTIFYSRQVYRSVISAVEKISALLVTFYLKVTPVKTREGNILSKSLQPSVGTYDIYIIHLFTKLKAAKLTIVCHNNNSLPNLHVHLLIITQQDYTRASSISIRIVWNKAAPLSFTREEETSPF